MCVMIGGGECVMCDDISVSRRRHDVYVCV